MSFVRYGITDAEKERVIKEALETPEGAKLIADAMRAPIRCGGMGYHNNVGYITHGGYPYPEQALRAVEAVSDILGEGIVNRWMEAYRKINDDYKVSGYPQLMEPADHWDWVEHRNDSEHFPAYSLWDTKRAIRDWLDVENLPCGNELVCDPTDLCDNCTKRTKAKAWLRKAAVIP